MGRVAGPLLFAALLLAGCVHDPYRDPVPGKEAVAVLIPGDRPTSVQWPVAYRRGAIFVIENRTGSPVETLLVDFSGPGAPTELTEVVIEEPRGKPARILWAPHGTWPLMAQLGEPGSVLLAPGESLRLRVQVAGEPGMCRAEISVPR